MFDFLALSRRAAKKRNEVVNRGEIAPRSIHAVDELVGARFPSACEHFLLTKLHVSCIFPGFRQVIRTATPLEGYMWKSFSAKVFRILMLAVPWVIRLTPL